MIKCGFRQLDICLEAAGAANPAFNQAFERTVDHIEAGLGRHRVGQLIVAGHKLAADLAFGIGAVGQSHGAASRGVDLINQELVALARGRG